MRNLELQNDPVVSTEELHNYRDICREKVLIMY